MPPAAIGSISRRLFFTLPLSFFFATFFGVAAMICAGIAFVLPLFGDVTIWQVLEYVGAPISLLPPEQRILAVVCYVVGVVVFTVLGVAHFFLTGWFHRRYGNQGVLTLNFFALVFLSEALYATFGYADCYFNLRYEWRTLMTPSPLFADEFQKVDPVNVPFGKKRNLVVLVGESIEEAFLDGTAYGRNLMPRLADWRQAHACFGEMLPVYGSDHTICSLFGMIYGSPRLQISAIAYSVSFSEYPEAVMPSAWRVWSANGFNCRFVKGGEIEFACTDKVFKAVPEVEVHDFSFYKDDPDYLKEPSKHPFGVNDEVVIAKRLKGETLELARKKAPFVLIAWTLNTHATLGWRSDLIPHRHEKVLVDAVMQADDLIVDYLEWLERQPFAKDTSIVFVGDHIFHGNFESVCNDDRRIVNTFVSDVKPIRRGPRIFAAFDLAPTFLELTGAKLRGGRFGIGTSLLGAGPTLLERLGRKRYEDEIRASAADYRRIALGWRR